MRVQHDRAWVATRDMRNWLLDCERGPQRWGVRGDETGVEARLRGLDVSVWETGYITPNVITAKAVIHAR